MVSCIICHSFVVLLSVFVYAIWMVLTITTQCLLILTTCDIKLGNHTMNIKKIPSHSSNRTNNNCTCPNTNNSCSSQRKSNRSPKRNNKRSKPRRILRQRLHPNRHSPKRWNPQPRRHRNTNSIHQKHRQHPRNTNHDHKQLEPNQRRYLLDSNMEPTKHSPKRRSINPSNINVNSSSEYR